MSLYYVDTSALVKRYVPEVGSPWVISWIESAQAHTIIISEITIIELVSALARRQREGAIASTALLQLRTDFLVHVDQEYVVLRVDSRLIIRAEQLVRLYPLRTLDALQLASALEAARIIGSMPTFVSADRNLLSIAAIEGFPTDNPNAHP